MAGDFKLADLLRKYKPRESQKGKLAKRYRDQLCWDCANACGGCNWSARYEPVHGWDAIATTRTVGGKFVEKSSSVRACPKFRRG